MFETTRNALVEWNRNNNDRQKLQQSYVVLLIATIFLAGIISLFNATRSQQLMYAAIILVTTLVTNFVIWSILKVSIFDKLPRRAAASPAATRRTPKRR